MVKIRPLLRIGCRPFLVLLQRLGYRKTLLRLEVGNWFGLPWNELFKADLSSRIRYDVQSVEFEDLLQSASPVELYVNAENVFILSYKGFRLWELCKSGILASLEVPVLPEVLSDREVKVVRFYYEKAAQALDGSAALLEKIKPTSVVTVQGCNPMARPLIEVARKMGIHVAGVEGCFSDAYFFCDDATGMIVNRHSGGSILGHWIDARDFTEEEREAFQQNLHEARSLKRQEHQTGGNSSAKCLRDQLQIDPGKKIAVFIGQVLTDAAIILDSKVYPDPAVLIKEVVGFFESKPEWFLIIRLHPKENGGSSWANYSDGRRFYGPPPEEPEGPLPYNDATFRRLTALGIPIRSDNHMIVYDKSVSTEDIFAESSLGITITSQAGLEFAFQHKRLVVCGDAFYREKGFTLQVSHQNALQPTLEAAFDQLELTEEEKLAVDRYGAFFLEHILFRKDLKNGRQRLLKTLMGS